MYGETGHNFTNVDDYMDDLPHLKLDMFYPMYGTCLGATGGLDKSSIKLLKLHLLQKSLAK